MCLGYVRGNALDVENERTMLNPPNKTTPLRYLLLTFFFFVTLGTGPRRPCSLEMSDGKVYEPNLAPGFPDPNFAKRSECCRKL